MARLRGWVGVVAVATALLAGCGGSKNPTDTGGDGGVTVTFSLSPTGNAASGASVAQAQVTGCFNFSCIDHSQVGCDVNRYQDCPKLASDWMSFPRTTLACAPFFCELTKGADHYSFTGTLLRMVTSGSGPLATGNYTRTNGGVGVEFGTFSASADGLGQSDSPDCPN
jgi:hypothetical protein